MISLKSKQEIALMRESAARLKQVFGALRNAIQPGVTTAELDQLAESKIRELKTKPAFKGYRGFPACVCTSINDEVVHGIPSKNATLKDGDLISLDMGLIYEGYYSDSARTFGVGRITEEAKELEAVTRGSMYAGMKQMIPGNRIGDISHAVQEYVESRGFSVVKDFVGHGIGRALHEDPQVPNFGKAGRGPKIEAGLVLAIEPMVTAGSYEVEILDDNWTVVTLDRELSAHHEDTIVITENGPVNLTGPQNEDEEV